MTVEEIIAPDRESITSIEESLDGMMARLETIISHPPLTEDTLVEIMAIYNNVAYIFLYLDAIDDVDNYQRLLPRRARFHDNPELDARVLALLEEMHCTDPEVEDARLEYIDQLRKGMIQDPTAEKEINARLAKANAVLDQLRDDQNRLVERIVAGGSSANPWAVYYKLISETTSATTRQKLVRAWRVLRDRRLDDLVAAVDEMIHLRRADSAAHGFPHVLARSLERSRLAEAEIEPFLSAYLRQAFDNHQKLAAEVSAATGITDDPMDHFEYALHSSFAEVPPPLFVLDECLDYIFAVTRSVFGLDIERVDDPHPDVIAVDVHRAGVPIGQIKFDLWNKGARKYAANHTNGIRNRTDWKGLVQRPVAYVACRFQADADGTNRITFQNIHSLFHEFGHALNHLLIRKRLSFQSGLEYLPPERLECLSMWFEKWVYHPEFSRFLTLPADDPDALERCKSIKMIEFRRTYAERATSAMLDFDVNRSNSGGLRESWERLDEKLGASQYTRFGDFPAYFTWPMYVGKPGANFAYLWGSAFSCEAFAPFRTLSLKEIADRPQLRELFESCFDFDAPSTPPNPAAVFDFYNAASLTGSA
ncbi:MAG TPA: M3 family metallopeptidase [Actinomycetales bacterium]|nr:M3 family metallopeptidase [Actinomycetales bacterium]